MAVTATEDVPPRSLPETRLSDLPVKLRPTARRYGYLWQIRHHPERRMAPYSARPRCGEGRTIHTDTVSMLERVLAMVERRLDEMDADDCDCPDECACPEAPEDSEPPEATDSTGESPERPDSPPAAPAEPAETPQPTP
ncbi:hypothetical protein GCM10022402_37220 [Salinactinospora qingdaonensis]|uniref:Uncharacterized protein n=1 Tax=Salinactinospora qingdaonensis TaxID=702744 RepID=A0ABP7G7P5_9ACTN